VKKTGLSRNSESRSLSRRSFISKGVGGLLLGSISSRQAWAVPSRQEPQDLLQSGVLVDLTRCIGCRSCENACLIRRGHPPLEPSPADYGYEPGEKKLTFRTWTFVDSPRVENAGLERNVPVKLQCMHCNEPACVAACPVAALQKTPRGAVVYRESRCIGCPFNVPRFEWNSGMFARVGKCDFCDDRVASGLSPACVAACTTGALKFGRRADLVEEGRARMASKPLRYISLYGDEIVGGTSWIYLSDVPMAKLGFRTDLPQDSLPSLTWQVVSKIPVVMVGVGLILAAGLWIRREVPPHEH
jgi:formate dehydrogenase iron-sulfur subunit